MTERKRSDVAEFDTQDKTEETLPPEHHGKTSGRFDFRNFLKRSGFPPAKLRDPSLGGSLLNNYLEWELAHGEIQNMIRDDLLDFIAVDPIPSDEAIIAKILRKKELAIKKLAGKKVLDGFSKLPETIRVSLMHYLFEVIEKTPTLPTSKIEGMADQMANLASMEMKNALISGTDPESTSETLHYTRITQTVIQIRERLTQVTEDIDETRPTIPCTYNKEEEEDKGTTQEIITKV